MLSHAQTCTTLYVMTESIEKEIYKGNTVIMCMYLYVWWLTKPFENRFLYNRHPSLILNEYSCTRCSVFAQKKIHSSDMLWMQIVKENKWQTNMCLAYNIVEKRYDVQCSYTQVPYKWIIFVSHMVFIKYKVQTGGKK